MIELLLNSYKNSLIDTKSILVQNFDLVIKELRITISY